jgi:hypothetical protein
MVTRLSPDEPIVVVSHGDGGLMVTTTAARSRAASGPRVIAAVLVLAGALVLAGCGGTAATNAPASVAPAATQASAAPESEASTDPASGGSGGSCGAATAAEVQKQLASPVVVRVSVDGGCHDAWIETTLDKTTVKEALAICDAAALIAYAGDISSVTVTGTDEVELSIGIKGQPCIGEP